MEGERGGQAAQQLRGWWVENMLVPKRGGFFFSPGEKNKQPSPSQKEEEAGVCVLSGRRKKREDERGEGEDDDGTRVARRGGVAGWLAGWGDDRLHREGGHCRTRLRPPAQGKVLKGRGMAGQKGSRRRAGGEQRGKGERGGESIRSGGGGGESRWTRHLPLPPSTRPPLSPLSGIGTRIRGGGRVTCSGGAEGGV